MTSCRFPRCCARAHTSKRKRSIDTNASEDLALVPEPELVFWRESAPRAPGPGLGWLQRCDPPLGPLLPNSRDTYSRIVFHPNHFHLSSITRRIRKHGHVLSFRLADSSGLIASPNARLKPPGPDIPRARASPRLIFKKTTRPVSRRASLPTTLPPSLHPALQCQPP